MVLKYLKTFILVATTHSFVKTSEKVFLSPTAVSQQMSALEDEVGVKLLERTNKGIQLTNAGKVFLIEAQDIDRRITDAIEKNRHEAEKKNDRLAIGVISSEVHRIIPLMNTMFAPSHPDVRIHYIQTSHIDRERDILNGIIDLAFTFGRDRADSEKLFHEVILEDIPACVIPQSNKLSKLDKISIEDLRGQHIFVVEPTASFFHDRMRKYIEENEPSITIETVNEGMGGRSLINTRACPYICPRMNTLKDKEFVIRPFISFGTINIGIVYGDNKNPLIKDCISVAKKVLQNEAVTWKWAN